MLTGRPPAALNERLKRGAPIPTPRLPLPTGIPADILLTRPDVRMAERQYAQYTAKVGQAEAARYPAVSLTGNIDTSAFKLGDLGKNSTDRLVVRADAQRADLQCRAVEGGRRRRQGRSATSISSPTRRPC